MKWYERDPVRFEIEKRLLARHHRGAKITIKNGAMCVHLCVTTRKDSYKLEAVFSSKHPYSPMRVYIRRPCLKGSPLHMYSGEQLCLHGADDAGPETTAKVYLDWAIQWIKTYEQWRAGKSWPRTNRG